MIAVSITSHPEFEMGDELERVVSETCLMVDKELLVRAWYSDSEVCTMKQCNEFDYSCSGMQA